MREKERERKREIYMTCVFAYVHAWVHVCVCVCVFVFPCRRAVVTYKLAVCSGVTVVIETPGFINEYEHMPEYVFIYI